MIVAQHTCSGDVEVNMHGGKCMNLKGGTRGHDKYFKTRRKKLTHRFFTKNAYTCPYPPICATPPLAPLSFIRNVCSFEFFTCVSVFVWQQIRLVDFFSFWLAVHM